MDVSFGAALLIIGVLLALAGALSGVMKGTVLSISVLSVAAGIVLAALDVVTVDPDSHTVLYLIEIALVLTLFADGLHVESELLKVHWGPPTRAIAVAMPVTIALLALAAHTLFGELSWAESFLLGSVLAATDPVVTSAVVTAQKVPAFVRHTLNLESGLNDGLALPFVLFFLVLAAPGGDAGHEALKLLGEAAFGALVGIVLGIAGGRFHDRVPGGLSARYEGIYALGFGLAAFGLSDVTIGNGLIAAFVAGIAMGRTEHSIPAAFTDYAEDVGSIFQVATFFVFGAFIVATSFTGSVIGLIAFIAFALAIARPAAILASFAGTGIPAPQRAFIAWFGPKGVASMLFSIYVLDSDVANAPLIFGAAAFVILASITAHGLTDTVGASWIERRMRVHDGPAAQPPG
jgi:NhaP-type Na+/H+ or K+/H+ antiporter